MAGGVLRPHKCREMTGRSDNPRKALRAQAAHPSTAPQVLSVRETMHRLRRGYAAVAALIESGALQTVMLGGRRMVVAESVDRLLGLPSGADVTPEALERLVRRRLADALRQLAESLAAQSEDH
jgi:hypothetical protein